MKPLAVCAIFKNEAPFLLEWLAHHHVIGFDRFVLYDNGSTDGGAALIRSSPLAGRVTIVQWPHRPGQITAYRDFIEHHARDFEWVAFIDLDEFLLPLDGDSVIPMLTALSGFAAVLVQWRCFGPSGWTTRPPGLAIENYDTRLPDDLPMNRIVKSIVHCASLVDVSPNPHVFAVTGPVCDPLGRVVGNVPDQPDDRHERLVLNHYVTRSKRDWLEKLGKGDAVSDDRAADYTPRYGIEVFDNLARDSRVKDDTIKRFAARIRALCAARPTAQAADPAAADPAGRVNVAAHRIELEPGMFQLSIAADAPGGTAGLPAVRVSPPPMGPPATISPWRGDGWLTPGDEPTLIRVPYGGAAILVTCYWPAADGQRSPRLRLTRVGHGPSSPSPA